MSNKTQTPCPADAAYISCDTMAECYNVSRETYVELWNALHDLACEHEVAGSGLSANECRGSICTRCDRVIPEEPAQALEEAIDVTSVKIAWPILTETARQDIARAIKEEG